MIDTDKRKAEGKYLSLTELSPCDTFWSECFRNVIGFFSTFQLSPLYRWENWGPEKLSSTREMLFPKRNWHFLKILFFFSLVNGTVSLSTGAQQPIVVGNTVWYKQSDWRVSSCVCVLNTHKAEPSNWGESTLAGHIQGPIDDIYLCHLFRQAYKPLSPKHFQALLQCL